jgi:hypothetical protein
MWWGNPKPASDLRSSAPVGQLLHGPAVAVRILEEEERSPREHFHVTHVDPSLDELGARRAYVRHHHLYRRFS